MKKLFQFILFIIFQSSLLPVMAQSGMKDLFVAETETAMQDSRQLVKGYISPMMKSFGLGMANGWYNTAKAHKTLGIDFTVTVNGVYIPDKDAVYNIEELNLQRIELVSVDGNTNAASAPTVFGPDADVQYRYTAPDNSTRDFRGPPGLGLEDKSVLGNIMPIPMAQVGIGLMKNTDLKLRYIPTIARDDYTFKFFGIGIMHDVKQYIPGVKTLPLDLSIFAGYTDLTFELDLSEGPSTEGQKATFNANAVTFQGLISKKIAILTIYGGLGVNRVSSELNMLGEYDFNKDGKIDATDPIKEMHFPVSGTRATIGARLKLLVLTLHADYTIQEYNVLTVGLGLSFR